VCVFALLRDTAILVFSTLASLAGAGATGFAVGPGLFGAGINHIAGEAVLISVEAAAAAVAADAVDAVPTALNIASQAGQSVPSVLGKTTALKIVDRKVDSASSGPSNFRTPLKHLWTM